MNAPAPTVFIVDDDPSFRRSTERLIRSAGYLVECFGAAAEFLGSGRQQTPGCLLLDVRLPGLNGLDLQRELSRAGWKIPIIFMTGHGDIPMSVQAMKAGALEFLTKPFREEALLAALGHAFECDRTARAQGAKVRELRLRYETLTPREREVMAHVVRGLLNKQIAAELGTVEKTVKFHRAHAMRKMAADSVAALVRMATHLEIPPCPTRPAAGLDI
jgi:FixJ family two-component response regulator